VQCQQIRKSNNLKVFESQKIKEPVSQKSAKVTYDLGA
jgi:hypothetical protein